MKISREYRRRSSRIGICALRIAAAVAVMTNTLTAHAQWWEGDEQEYNRAFRDDSKPWQELSVPLPAAPKSGNLISFYVSPTATESFAIDVNSLRIDDDGVIRFTLVATSPHGARSVSYEGIRCSTFESKSYAFGQPDGSWYRARHGKWKSIHGYAPNRPQSALANDYFCSDSTIAGTKEDIESRLRHKRPLRPQTDTSQ